jgi:hypothetical protein
MVVAERRVGDRVRVAPASWYLQAHVPAAVDAQRLACDRRARRPYQEQQRSDEIIRITEREGTVACIDSRKLCCPSVEIGDRSRAGAEEPGDVGATDAPGAAGDDRGPALQR